MTGFFFIPISQHLTFFPFPVFITRQDDGHWGCMDSGRQRPFSIFQMAEVLNLPVSHTPATLTQSPALVWFEEGWGRGVGGRGFFTPSSFPNPPWMWPQSIKSLILGIQGTIAHSRTQQRQCQLLPLAKKKKNARRPLTAGGPKITSPIGWPVEICLPLPPAL